MILINNLFMGFLGLNIVIVGASGYIGTRITSFVTMRGYHVTSASRKKCLFNPSSWIHFDIELNEPVIFPINTDIVVHLATRNNTKYGLDSIEVNAAKRLLISAKNVNARFIFVSSQTARADAPTTYGRTKWRIEQEVLSVGGYVVRPGQVYGGQLRGLFGTLVKTVQKFPLLPAFIPSPKVQPIHVDDLVEGLLRIAERVDINPGVYCLAAPIPITFYKFLAEIANSRLRSNRFFIPVPVMGINFLTAFLRTALQNRLGLERLKSLFDLPIMNTNSDLDKLGLVLRPLSSGLHPSGDDRRRRVLQEGRALLKYILKKEPDSVVLRRYLRAIESLRDGQEIKLPRIFLIYPILISLIGKSSWSDVNLANEYVWRLDAATSLAEASVLGAYRFLSLDSKCGMLRSLLSIMNAFFDEAFWRIAKFFLSPMLRLLIARTKVGL